MRQRWSVGPVCKTGAFGHSVFESHHSHKFLIYKTEENEFVLIRELVATKIRKDLLHTFLNMLRTSNYQIAHAAVLTYPFRCEGSRTSSRAARCSIQKGFHILNIFWCSCFREQ